MISIIGYMAMACLIVAAIPQAIKAVREGHSKGIAGGYIGLLLAGFILMLTYLWVSKPVVPVMINYAVNILMMLIIGYYKVFPRHEKENNQS